jgi:hypothetical protein
MTHEMRADVREAWREAEALAKEEAERAARLALPQERNSIYRATYNRVYREILAAKGLCPTCEATGVYRGQACTDCFGRGYQEEK